MFLPPLPDGNVPNIVGNLAGKEVAIGHDLGAPAQGFWVLCVFPLLAKNKDVFSSNVGAKLPSLRPSEKVSCRLTPARDFVPNDLVTELKANASQDGKRVKRNMISFAISFD